MEDAVVWFFEHENAQLAQRNVMLGKHCELLRRKLSSASKDPVVVKQPTRRPRRHEGIEQRPYSATPSTSSIHLHDSSSHHSATDAASHDDDTSTCAVEDFEDVGRHGEPDLCESPDAWDGDTVETTKPTNRRHHNTAERTKKCELLQARCDDTAVVSPKSSVALSAALDKLSLHISVFAAELLPSCAADIVKVCGGGVEKPNPRMSETEFELLNSFRNVVASFDRLQSVVRSKLSACDILIRRSESQQEQLCSEHRTATRTASSASAAAEAAQQQVAHLKAQYEQATTIIADQQQQLVDTTRHLREAETRMQQLQEALAHEQCERRALELQLTRIRLYWERVTPPDPAHDDTYDPFQECEREGTSTAGEADKAVWCSDDASPVPKPAVAAPTPTPMRKKELSAEEAEWWSRIRRAAATRMHAGPDGTSDMTRTRTAASVPWSDGIGTVAELRNGPSRSLPSTVAESFKPLRYDIRHGEGGGEHADNVEDCNTASKLWTKIPHEHRVNTLAAEILRNSIEAIRGR